MVYHDRAELKQSGEGHEGESESRREGGRPRYSFTYNVAVSRETILDSDSCHKTPYNNCARPRLSHANSFPAILQFFRTPVSSPVSPLLSSPFVSVSPLSCACVFSTRRSPKNAGADSATPPQQPRLLVSLGNGDFDDDTVRAGPWKIQHANPLALVLLTSTTMRWE